MTIIARDCCAVCDDNVMEGDTGYRYCRASLGGDPDDCTRWQAMQELEAKATASAEHWAHRVRHTPADVRRDAIEAEAGVYEDWSYGLGAVFDAGAWIGLCVAQLKVVGT